VRYFSIDCDISCAVGERDAGDDPGRASCLTVRSDVAEIHFMRTYSNALLPILCAAFVSGCNGGFTVAPVSGKVTCKNVPIKDAAIIFSPLGSEGEKQPGKAAGGSVDDQGNFFVGTYTSNDGAIVGKHRVSISFNNPYEPQVCAPPKDLILEVKGGRNVFAIELDPAYRK